MTRAGHGIEPGACVVYRLEDRDVEPIEDVFFPEEVIIYTYIHTFQQKLCN